MRRISESHSYCKYVIDLNISAGFNELMVFVGTKSRSRIFQLSPPRNDKRYHVIVTVQVDHLTTKVIVRSPLQVSSYTVSTKINKEKKKKSKGNAMCDKVLGEHKVMESLWWKIIDEGGEK